PSPAGRVRGVLVAPSRRHGAHRSPEFGASWAGQEYGSGSVFLCLPGLQGGHGTRIPRRRGTAGRDQGTPALTLRSPPPQPYAGPGPDSGLRLRGTPLGPPPPPPSALAYGAFGPPAAFQPFPAVPPPAAGSAHLQPVAMLYPGRAPAPPGAPGGPPGLQPLPGAPAPPPPTPAHALGGMDAELIDEEALTSLELELGLHRVRELPELFLGQSEFDCFSDLGSAPPAGSVSC
uniref:Cbp/p300 interacting transactivator with Glu/Asp rich carboxy-terminal domain 4 n=1 Tax=Equus caballus TaxID=9796 RepID=A0A9L0S368_HORSE